MALGFALASGVLAVTAALAARYALARSLANRLERLDLRPNCLLTRHPILFIAGARRLFRPFDRWREAPAYLREHGYDVLEISTARGPMQANAILEAIRAVDGKLHVIGDARAERLMGELARAKEPRIASLTLLKPPGTAAPSASIRSAFSPDDLRPLDTALESFEVDEKAIGDAPWTVEGKVLDLAISLAERDAGCCD